MKIKQRPEDFVVREAFRFQEDAEGDVWVYRMDKQKVSTLQALERIGKEWGVRRRNLSVCGLKDKQGRTEQLVGVQGGALGEREVVQAGDLRLTLIGRTAQPLTSGNLTSNRFEVTVRDLDHDDCARIPESVAEVSRVGVINYFDSQRFGFLKHGQGFIARHLLHGDWEGALKAFLATPSELDRSEDAKVKQFWAQHWGEWQKHAPHDAAKRYAPILRRLRQAPDDFKGAFLHIDRRIRAMALFELQSFLWNEGVKRYLTAQVKPADLIGLRYQAGALLFPRALGGDQRAWAAKTFPLLAPDSKFSDPAIEKAAQAALQSQNLKLAQLTVPGAEGALFFKHEERPLLVFPGKLRVNDPRPDELNRGKQKVNLSFTLPSGAYATLVVRRVLWFAAEGARSLAAEPAPQPTRSKVPSPRRAPEPGRPTERAAAAFEREVKPSKPKAAWGQPLAHGSDWDEDDEVVEVKPKPPRPASAPDATTTTVPASAEVKGFRAKQKARKEAKALRREKAATKKASTSKARPFGANRQRTPPRKR